MNFINWLARTSRRVGSALASGARRIGGLIQQGAKKVGEVGGGVVEFARQLAPYIKDMGFFGKAVQEVADKGDKVVQVAKDIGEGNIRSGVQGGLGLASMYGGRMGQIGKTGTAMFGSGLI